MIVKWLLICLHHVLISCVFTAPGLHTKYLSSCFINPKWSEVQNKQNNSRKHNIHKSKFTTKLMAVKGKFTTLRENVKGSSMKTRLPSPLPLRPTLLGEPWGVQPRDTTAPAFPGSAWGLLQDGYAQITSSGRHPCSNNTQLNLAQQH